MLLIDLKPGMCVATYCRKSYIDFRSNRSRGWVTVLHLFLENEFSAYVCMLVNTIASKQRSRLSSKLVGVLHVPITRPGNIFREIGRRNRPQCCQMRTKTQFSAKFS